MTNPAHASSSAPTLRIVAFASMLVRLVLSSIWAVDAQTLAAHLTFSATLEHL